MLDNEDYIVAKIKEKNPAKTENKIIKWFMFNEISTSPLHPSNFLPEWQQCHEGGRDQNDTLQSLTNLDQNTPTGKKKRQNDTHSEKTMEQSYGCK